MPFDARIRNGARPFPSCRGKQTSGAAAVGVLAVADELERGDARELGKERARFVVAAQAAPELAGVVVADGRIEVNQARSLAVAVRFRMRFPEVLEGEV